MKFNRIITVLLLCLLCSAGKHNDTAHAKTSDTVISNQVTLENDTEQDSKEEQISDSTEDALTASGAGICVATQSSVALVSDAGIAAENGTSVETVSDTSITVVSESAVKKQSTIEALAADDELTETKEEVKNEPTVKATTKVMKATKVTTKKKYTKAELRLMSSLIYCEASGEPYAGKLAVGIVVMNRKSSKSFPNTVKGVIYQKYQFGPARNGSLKRALKQYDAGKFTSASEKASIKAAKAALNGTKKVTYRSKTYNMKTFYYFSTRVKGKRLTIKNHQFK